MTLPLLGLIEQVLRLLNNLIEADPPEVRLEKARLWWELWKPVVLPLLPADARARLEAIEAAGETPRTK